MKPRRSATPTPLAPFQRGQIFRIGDVNLAVTSVGKTLVHYRQCKTQPRGTQINLAAKPNLQKYLMDSKAVLISEQRMKVIVDLCLIPSGSAFLCLPTFTRTLAKRSWTEYEAL